MYPGEWKGDADKKTGTAVFMVDGKKYELPLNGFESYLLIAEMLETAHQMGREFGADAVCGAAVAAAQRRAAEFHTT